MKKINEKMKKRITRFKTKDDAVANISKGDRLFHDPFINEYFIISPRKNVWKEGEFEDNFIIMPETLEECIKLRAHGCQDCDYLPQREGNAKYCRKRGNLLNREKMEIF